MRRLSVVLCAKILIEDGEPLATADAERRDPISHIGTSHFVEQLDGDDCAGRANRMAQRNAAAVHVDPGRVQAERLDARHGLGRESFVQLKQADVVRRQPAAFE